MGNSFLPATAVVTFLAVAVGDTAALQDVRHEPAPTVTVAPVEVVTVVTAIERANGQGGRDGLRQVDTMRALELVPYWRYVRDVLLPQIRKAVDRLIAISAASLVPRRTPG